MINIELPATIPDDATLAYVTLTIKDRTTDKQYSCESTLDVDE